MLIYFHKNRARYEKGQVAPFFILILVVLIIMALVTINLSKVVSTRTDASNAVDSGALAAGSVMANVFNAVARANSQLETYYWEFLAGISVSFGIAIGFLVAALSSAISAETLAASALAQACASPCTATVSAAAAEVSAGAAIGWLGKVSLSIIGIIASVTAFQIAEYHFYLSIREMADEGRESAVRVGHQLVFSNSGIGSKLRQKGPLGEASDFEKWIGKCPHDNVTEEDKRDYNYRNKL